MKYSFQGADCFAAKVNLEVQWANEQSIAAVERNGGVITTSYYDISCVTAMVNPQKWFKGRLKISSIRKSQSLLQMPLDFSTYR